MHLTNPALTVALALAAGVLAQSLARHLKLPGIVLLLLTGVLLGPDVAGIVRPRALGPSLEMLVGISVAVILFDGGLNLNLARLRNEGAVIRRLITLGGLVNAVGGALAARLTMGWPWSIAILFGTLVIVTGPTVTTPLLRRIRVQRSVETVLEAEGVLLDPIGAIVAVVALEVVLAHSAAGAARHLLGLPYRLVLGSGIGAVGGLLVGGFLRYGHLVPEGYENIFALSLVLALFEISDAILPQSGILASVVAGLIVANVDRRASRELREFKEQLTTLFIGMLFVLLAADVRLANVVHLGWPGLLTVAALMLVVRPLNVLAGTWGSSLDRRERAFMMWLAPRGIVAAAVASVFAERLAAAGSPYGTQLRALVFLVIAITVVLQGSTGGLLAAVLGLRRGSDRGFVLVGANPLGRAIAGVLADAGEDVVLIDTNATETQAAERSGLRVIRGNANEEAVLDAADVAGRRGFVAVTPNEGANLLLAERVRAYARGVSAYVALDLDKPAVTPGRAWEARVRLLFDGPIDVTRWIEALRHGDAELQTWSYSGPDAPLLRLRASGAGQRRPLPLVHLRGTGASPVTEDSVLREGDRVVFAVPQHPPLRPLSPGVGEWIIVDTPGMRVVEASFGVAGAGGKVRRGSDRAQSGASSPEIAGRV